MQLIASRRYRARRPDGEEFELEIGVGQPVRCSDRDGCWKCAVSLKGLYGQLADMHGGDSWQALMVALGLARQLLAYVVEDGGTLCGAAGGPPAASVEEIFRSGLL